MDEKRITFIKEKLSVFGFKIIQDSAAMLKVASRNGISLEEIIEFKEGMINALQEKLKQAEAQAEEIYKEKFPCPKCGSGLRFRPINIPHGPRNKFGYTMHWFCNAEKCTYEKYTKDPFIETMEAYEIKVSDDASD